MLKTISEVVTILKNASAENVFSAFRSYLYYLSCQGEEKSIREIIDLEHESIGGFFFRNGEKLWYQIKKGNVKTDCRYIAEMSSSTEGFRSYKYLDEFVDYQALAKWLISEAPYVMDWACPDPRSMHHDALYRCDNEAVTLFLVQIGADVNVHNDNYDLLTQCIENRWTETAKEIIAKGADLRGYNPNDFRKASDMSLPLLSAVDKEDLEIVKLLLKSGADPNAGIRGRDDEDDEVDRYPLLEAVYHNNSEIISLLLKYGADINIRDRQGNTALLIAAYIFDYDAAKLLIDAGANINVKNKEKQNVISVVASELQYNNMDVEKTKDFLGLFGPEYDVPNKSGERLLDFLCQNDHFGRDFFPPELVFWLIDRGFTADENSYAHYLSELVKRNNKTYIKSLFAKRAKKSPHFAVATPDSEITGNVLVCNEKKALIICHDNVFTYIDPRTLEDLPVEGQKVGKTFFEIPLHKRP